MKSKYDSDILCDTSQIIFLYHHGNHLHIRVVYNINISHFLVDELKYRF